MDDELKLFLFHRHGADGVHQCRGFGTEADARELLRRLNAGRGSDLYAMRAEHAFTDLKKAAERGELRALDLAAELAKLRQPDREDI